MKRLALAFLALVGMLAPAAAQSTITSSLANLPIFLQPNVQTDYAVGIDQVNTGGIISYVVRRVPLSTLTGPAGPANTLGIGAISTLPAGSSATAFFTGVSPNQLLSLGLPAGVTGPQGLQGVTGPTGAAANIASVSSTTLAPGSQATATLGGTAPNYTLAFGIPRGTPGNGNGNVNSTGTIRTGALAIYGDTTGNVIQDGGLPAAVATSGSASDLSAGTLAAARLPALTGDVTTSAGSAATTLATSGVTAGSYILPSVTFDAKGRATAASSASTTGTGAVVQAASPALTGTPTVPTAAAGTSTTQAASTAFVGAALSPYAPLASPALTGTPTVPTAAAGTSTTQVASTAFVGAAIAAAPSGGGAPSAVNALSAAYTVQASDKGKTLVLTGSFTVTEPACSANAGLYFWVKKTDGNGDVLIQPASGTTDGLASKHVYQESFLEWCDGTNWRSQDRPKGWISVASNAISGTPTSVSSSIGFADPEIFDMEFIGDNMVPSGTDTFIAQVQKGGSYLSGGYLGQYTQFDSRSGYYGTPSSSIYLTPNGSTSPQYFRLYLPSFALINQRATGDGFDTGSNRQAISQTAFSTTGAIQAVQFLAGSGSKFSSGTISQKGFRR